MKAVCKPFSDSSNCLRGNVESRLDFLLGIFGRRGKHVRQISKRILTMLKKGLVVKKAIADTVFILNVSRGAFSGLVMTWIHL